MLHIFKDQYFVYAEQIYMQFLAVTRFLMF